VNPLLKKITSKRKFRTKIISLALAGVLTLGMLTGCGQIKAVTGTEAGAHIIETAVAGTVAAQDGSAAVLAAQGFEFDEEDFLTTWEETGATKVTLNGTGISVEGEGAAAEGSTLRITAPGTYVLSGNLDQGQVAVNVGSDEVVRLVLNGVTITNQGAPTILIEEADRAYVTLAEGSVNMLTMAAASSEEGVAANTDAQADPDAVADAGDEAEDTPDGAIYSKGDLTLNGSGALTVCGSAKHGIVGRDDLRITGGVFDITAVSDAVRGKDLIAIYSGDFMIVAGADAFQSSNADEADKGFIVIEGGRFQIKSGADGLQAETALVIEDGDFEIESGDDGIHADVSVLVLGGDVEVLKSCEGLEGAEVTIRGGEISLVSSDDGINTSGEKGLSIEGGFVLVNADGDGIDLNGSGAMSGGILLIHGPTNNGNGAMDFNGDFIQSGGLLIAAGSSGMAQGPSESSTELSAQIFLTSQAAGTMIRVEAEDGTVIAAFKPAKTFTSLVVASPEFVSGETYHVYVGGSSSGEEAYGLVTGGASTGGTEAVNFEISGSVTQAVQEGASAGGGMGGGMKRPRNQALSW